MTSMPYLEMQRLPTHVPIGHPRFVARTREEHLVATFTMWNVLDSVMARHSKSNWQMGYVREVQVRRMLELVAEPRVRVYCEVGMNGGHSAAAMLIGNPRVVVHSFDLYEHEYAGPAASLLNLTFGNRFVSHPGDSRMSVPAWVADSSNRCDLLLVDGDHSAKGAKTDLVNLRPASTDGAPVVVDDVNLNEGHASGPMQALHSMSASGTLSIIEEYGPYNSSTPQNPCTAGVRHAWNCFPWGFVVASYNTAAGIKGMN